VKANRLLLAALAAAVVSACTTPPDEPVLVDACQLFTMEDAVTAAGELLSGRMTSTLDDASGRPDPMRCLYNVGTTQDARLVGLEVRSHRSPEAARRAVEGSRALLGNLTRGEVEEIAGVGDAALWGGGEVDQLYVATGSYQLIITVQTQHGKERERATEAALKVVERLGEARD
jgi:hypothetical protein